MVLTAIRSGRAHGDEVLAVTGASPRHDTNDGGQQGPVPGSVMGAER
jgi:hypothetical protein